MYVFYLLSKIHFFLSSCSTAVAVIRPLNTTECPTSVILTSRWIINVTYAEQLMCIPVSQILCKRVFIYFLLTSLYCCKISDKFNCEYLSAVTVKPRTVQALTDPN